MAKLDPRIQDHLEWIGYVRPEGLVVSAPALVRAGAILDRRDAEGQRLLHECLDERLFPGEQDPAPFASSFRSFAQTVLGWTFSPKAYAGTPESPIPSELELALPEYAETLRPDFAVRELDPEDGASPWQLLVRVLEPGESFDRIVRGAGRLEVSAHGRMERLLRQTRAPAGLLFNGRSLRLISAPRGESSGWLDFHIAEMVQTAGRPICTALRLLLGQTRLLSLPRQQRFAALLTESRKYQNEVSERLSEQVLHALYELLRGFQAAHDSSRGELLRGTLAADPDEVYRALLTVLLRHVFLFYAQERGMLPDDETFVRYYSLAGLYDRLREDAALYPDTMDQRFGAWAQLVVLFRMVHNGAAAGAMHLPARHGVLFDPDRFPFLEGRARSDARPMHEGINPPLVPDGTIFRVLEKLLVLDGERISYGALDVEQIGSVYETMMGFRLETATGRSVAIKAQKRGGVPTAVDLDALLAEAPAKRPKWLQDRVDRKFADTLKKGIVDAESLEDLHAALLPAIDVAATPDLVPREAMVLQPSQERRRSGSHYTPRALTEPIVRTTLEPILARLRGPDGGSIRPEQILGLKVCDPAMGSGAFLVEACRQLGDALVSTWHAHDALPPIPPDEDEILHARRLVATRCLYGVDRNPMAVDLAKLSLWLVTLAKDHPFTFLDHAIRHGDSLVGLGRRELERFHWSPEGPAVEFTQHVWGVVAESEARRVALEEMGDSDDHEARCELLSAAQERISRMVQAGDAVVACYFAADSDKARHRLREELVQAARELLDEGTLPDKLQSVIRGLREGMHPVIPFHWEIEFPEVFSRERPGFDAIVGNPPFAGKNTVGAGNAKGYPDWLQCVHEQSHGNSDLVAHFFRRAFHLVREGGAFGLIATNTIGQGDTRASGLRWICQHGGDIFAARKRLKWPGLAAVVVSVVHVMKGTFAAAKRLDERLVEIITAFLFHRGRHDDPVRLSANAGKSFQGTIVLGMGFTFDDTDSKGVASPIAEMHRLIEKEPRNQEVILPYIGGDEVNTSPTHEHHRYVINFGERSEEACRRRWPDLMAIVEAKVRPERIQLADNPDGRRRKKYWWQFGRYTPALFAATAGLERVLVICRHEPKWALAFVASLSVFAESLIVFPLRTYSAFCTLQSRPHEIWARFFGSTLEDRLRYTPSDCFETFPFPDGWETHPTLEAAGKAYYEFRASLMQRNDEGLTKAYNRFHDRDEHDANIENLRELHAAMDRAVIDAYGWSDIATDCEYLLDYEIDEEEWGNKKKPWRYRWPDAVRDEVLARLLELNAERARDESRAGATVNKRPRGRKVRVKRGAGADDSQRLFS